LLHPGPGYLEAQLTVCPMCSELAAKHCTQSRPVRHVHAHLPAAQDIAFPHHRQALTTRCSVSCVSWFAFVVCTSSRTSVRVHCATSCRTLSCVRAQRPAASLCHGPGRTQRSATRTCGLGQAVAELFGATLGDPGHWNLSPEWYGTQARPDRHAERALLGATLGSTQARPDRHAERALLGAMPGGPGLRRPAPDWCGKQALPRWAHCFAGACGCCTSPVPGVKQSRHSPAQALAKRRWCKFFCCFLQERCRASVCWHAGFTAWRFVTFSQASYAAQMCGSYRPGCCVSTTHAALHPLPALRGRAADTGGTRVSWCSSGSLSAATAAFPSPRMLRPPRQRERASARSSGGCCASMMPRGRAWRGWRCGVARGARRARTLKQGQRPALGSALRRSRAAWLRTT
jgi:hypothetical protein